MIYQELSSPRMDDKVAALRRGDIYEEDGLRLERALVIFSRVLLRIFVFAAGIFTLQWLFGASGIQSW